MDTEKQIQEIDRKILLTNILDLPGTVMFGLGLYGKFAANGNAFVPWLNDGPAVNFLLVFGALAGAKALLEHNLELNLVGDRHPDLKVK